MALVGTVGGAPPANAYSGFEWEAQRLLSDMTLAQRAVSILKTGALPVLLQKRVFAYNGDGLSVNIYKNPTYTGVLQMQCTISLVHPRLYYLPSY